MFIVGVTGHRPPDLGGYSDAAAHLLARCAQTALEKLQPVRIIVGMALGWDQACAHAAVELGIPFDAYVPFDGQEKVWPLQSRKRYAQLLEKAATIRVFVDHYEEAFMKLRNQGIVDDSELMLACYNGYPYSGTADCIVRAENAKRQVINVYSEWKSDAASSGLLAE